MIKACYVTATIQLAIILSLSGCDRDNSRYDTYINSIRVRSIQSSHYRNLIDTFDSFSYNMNTVNNGVPPLLLRRLPDNIHLIRPTAAKKHFFFQAILPMALLGNEEIKQQRDTLLNIFSQHDKGAPIPLHQHEEMINIQQRYEVEGDALQDLEVRKKLLRRVDIIPPSLTLAQAANESGWGLSRFAQQANNIFGEWTFTPGTGLVPEDRPEGKTYEVRRFDSLYSSVRSYLHNLNTHSAYTSMRHTRQRLRKNGLPLTGYTLAGDMQFYSTRREAYVDEIRTIIISNRLGDLNQAKLALELREVPIEPEKKANGLLSSMKSRLNESKL